MVMPKASWLGEQEDSEKPAFGERGQSGTPAAVGRTRGQEKPLLFAGLEGPGTHRDKAGVVTEETKAQERDNGEGG